MSKAQTQANIVFNLPDFALKLLHPKAAIVLRENRLHIALQMLLAGMPELPLEDDTPPAAIREALAANPVDLGPKTSGPVQRVDHQVTVGKGTKVLVREYIPKGAEDSGCAVVYFHGGGWVLMNVDSHDKPVAHMAESLGVRAYSVDYRLAPEHPFPTPLDDCAKAWDWVQKHTGLQPGQLVAAGDSAGGNLATALCLRLKEAEQAAARPAVADLPRRGRRHGVRIHQGLCRRLLPERQSHVLVLGPLRQQAGRERRQPAVQPPGRQRPLGPGAGLRLHRGL